ncbi:sialate:O-sulfotransferase 2-like [Ptychodera flava]|uniref:sialate:O-sulfotransferase 2-like n=1 Tax=Ptychodera flava TaxID=63121 RepID=UPI00396A6409
MGLRQKFLWALLLFAISYSIIMVTLFSHQRRDDLTRGKHSRSHKYRNLREGNILSSVLGTVGDSHLLDNYLGCVNFTGNIRDSLPGKQYENLRSLTPTECVRNCTEKNFTLAAIEGASNCYCGNRNVNFTVKNLADDKMCNLKCGGDTNAPCGGSQHYSVYRTKVVDSSCNKRSFLEAYSVPLIALASFPGSGNTWIRHLLERATGIFTGSVYNDRDLYKHGFKGESEKYTNGKTLFIKTHIFDRGHIEEFDAAILVIRNPYKAIVSEHNRKFGGHTGHASAKKYIVGDEWVKFVMGKSRTWTNTAINWLQYSKRILVIYYEDLIEDHEREIRKILNFIELPENNGRLLCLSEDTDGPFKRPEKREIQRLDFDPFTDDMKEYIDIFIRTVAMAIELKAQPPLPSEYIPNF